MTSRLAFGALRGVAGGALMPRERSAPRAALTAGGLVQPKARSNMHTLPEVLASEIRTYLAASGVKLATDHGLVTFREVARVLVAEVDGVEIGTVTIAITRR